VGKVKGRVEKLRKELHEQVINVSDDALFIVSEIRVR